jgi:hypothetical protein
MEVWTEDFAVGAVQFFGGYYEALTEALPKVPGYNVHWHVSALAHAALQYVLVQYYETHSHVFVLMHALQYVQALKYVLQLQYAL